MGAPLRTVGLVGARRLVTSDGVAGVGFFVRILAKKAKDEACTQILANRMKDAQVMGWSLSLRAPLKRMQFTATYITRKKPGDGAFQITQETLD